MTGRLPEVQWLVTAVESDPGASQPVMRTEYRYGAPAFGRPSHADDVSPEPMQFMGWGRVEVYPPVAPEAGGVRQIVHRYRYGNAIPGDPLGGDGRGFLVEEAVYVLEGPAARLHEVSTHRYASELLHRDAEGRELRFVHPTGSEHRVCMPNASGVYDEAACRADTTHYTQRFELWEPWSHAGATTPTLFLKRSESFYEGMGGRSRKVAMDYDVRVRGPEGAFFGVWYQVLPTRQTTYRVTEGSGEVFREEPLARSEMAYDAYGLPWVERHWRGDTSAPEVVIERTFDTTTGNELSIKRPRQVVLGNLGKRTTFDYDQHKLYRTLTTNELGHMVRDVTDVGTGMVLRRQGPNAKVVPTVCGPDPKVAFCLPDVVYDEDAWTIDGFGRVLTHSTSMDTSTSYALTLVERYTYVDGVDTYVKAERLRDVGGTVWLAQQTHHDGLGRVLRERDLAVTHDETRYLYDQGGAVVRIDSPDPRPTGDTGGKVSFGFQHDVLGRVTRFTRPDTWLSGTRIQYPSPLERRVYEVYVSGGTELPASTTIGRYDLEGRLIEVEEYAAPLALDAGMVPPAGDLTSYQYDELGQLAAVDDPEGRTELTHDWLGQRTSITRGIRTWRYEYDLDGNLEVEESPHEASADPSAYRTRTLYDVLGRPTIRMPAPRDMTPARMEELGIGVTRFTYDEGTNGKGQLARVWIGIPGTSVTPATDYLNVEYAYQAQGLVAKETRTFSPPGYAPVTQWVERDYDAVGQLRLSKWDDGQSWRITTDGRGLVQQVAYQAPGSSSWQTVAWYSRGAAGLPRYRTTLNMAMVRRDWSYDALGRVTFDVVKASSGTVATRNYVYGASGDLLQVLGSNRVDVTTTHWAGAMYTYDAKHQLETAGPTSTPSSSSGYTATMEYSPSGNILKAEIGGIGRDSRRVGYVYGGDDEGVDRQAVKQLVALDGAGNPIPDQVLGAFEYDLAGNMTSRTWLGQTTELVWDSDDQLRQVRAPSGAIETYAYDHTAGRVWAIAENAGDASGVRLWFAESETFLPASGATKRRYLHLSDGGGTVARTEHTGPASGIDATSTTPVIELQFADALQNLMVSMRASGTTATVTASFVYGAWGEVVPSKVKGEGDHRRQFNGKEADAVSGLRYYGFRYYDPLVMRWTSADPLFLVAPDAGLASPRRNGLYTFSLNNANQYYDPDGRNADDKDEGKKSAEPVLLDQAATHVSYAGYGDFYTVTWSYGGESGEVVVEGGYVQGPEAAVDGRPHTGRVDLVEYDGFTLAVPRIWGPTLTPRVWTAMMAAKASYAQEVDPLISRGMIIATLGMAYGISFGALPRYSVAVQAPGLARAAPRSAAGGGGRATGQLHHAISRPIHRALEQHPVLRGVYQARDPRLVLRAADGAAHRGYQQWHRALDQEVVDWLRANEAATPAQFEAYLRSLYQRPDLVQRFPLGFE